MRFSQKGEISTVVILGVFVVVGISTLTSSLLNKDRVTTQTNAQSDGCEYWTCYNTKEHNGSFCELDEGTRNAFRASWGVCPGEEEQSAASRWRFERSEYHNEDGSTCEPPGSSSGSHRFWETCSVLQSTPTPSPTPIPQNTPTSQPPPGVTNTPIPTPTSSSVPPPPTSSGGFCCTNSKEQNGQFCEEDIGTQNIFISLYGDGCEDPTTAGASRWRFERSEYHNEDGSTCEPPGSPTGSHLYWEMCPVPKSSTTPAPTTPPTSGGSGGGGGSTPISPTPTSTRPQFPIPDDDPSPTTSVNVNYIQNITLEIKNTNKCIEKTYSSFEYVFSTYFESGKELIEWSGRTARTNITQTSQNSIMVGTQFTRDNLPYKKNLYVQSAIYISSTDQNSEPEIITHSYLVSPLLTNSSKAVFSYEVVVDCGDNEILPEPTATQIPTPSPTYPTQIPTQTPTPIPVATINEVKLSIGGLENSWLEKALRCRDHDPDLRAYKLEVYLLQDSKPTITLADTKYRTFTHGTQTIPILPPKDVPTGQYTVQYVVSFSQKTFPSIELEKKTYSEQKIISAGDTSIGNNSTIPCPQ